jgi:hypothetical protein
MKKILLLVATYVSILPHLTAQNVGDTITIESFNYTQTYSVNQWSPGIRDTIIDFSVLPDQPIEKVLMLYNMRCKNNLVSNSNNRDQGCGEWDISCNTYLYDSTRTDSLLYTHLNYIISNFSGSDFDYTSQAIYDLWQYEENNITLNDIISESSFSILSGTENINTVFNGSQKSGKSQYLYTASELIAAGFSAGEIDGLMVESNNSGTIHFLRVKLKTTTDTELAKNNPINDGLTEVFFNNAYTFQNGSNRLQFDAAFNWNGTDNLIVEFSFTNSTPTNDVQLKGIISSNKGIYANNGYHINSLNNGYVNVPVNSISSIQNEMTISFWAYGNPEHMPSSTTLLEAVDSNGARTINLHLPWGNSNIYFDCGNTGNSIDRINKVATEDEFEGQWNHWAFTKNTNSGSMKIFLNGNEWLTGNGKTKPINVDKMIIGGDRNGNLAYKGKIDELRIWDKELSTTEINEWDNIGIDNSHPYYSNLMAYFKMDEGSDTLINDASENAVTAIGNSPYFWEFTRGSKINRFFKTDDKRPNISLLRGDYNLSVSQINVFDSIQREPNLVRVYNIIQHIGTQMHDEVNLDSEVFLWEAIGQNIYDASTGNILSSTPIQSEGSYSLSDLEYQKRFPAKIEIMSFVTPYGLGLNLG